MKTLNELREGRQANAARVVELTEKLDRVLTNWRTKDPFREDYKTLSAELETANRIGLILKNNYNNVLAAQVLPALVDLLNKYNGKKCGGKTIVKISDEFKAATGCGIYFDRFLLSNKCAHVKIYEMHNGYKHGEEIEFYTKANAYIINDDNIIQAQPAGAFQIFDFYEYIEDPAKRVSELDKKKKEIDEMRAKLNKAINNYNVLAVNGIPHEKRA